MKIHVEVFIASRILGQNQGTFSPDDLMRFIRKEFHDERPGIPTHVTAACVANAPLNHTSGYNYLWRVGPGLMRVFRPGQDHPETERVKDRVQPEREDLPERFRYLLVA
jgi:hypothetical protein